MPFLIIPAGLSACLVLFSIVISLSDSNWVATSVCLWVAYGLMTINAAVLFVATYWKLVPR